MTTRLLFPPPSDEASAKRVTFGVKQPVIPSWPWRATMLTALNAYSLWSLTWLQFVTTLAFFAYDGSNLWFYAVRSYPFGLSIPEGFLAFSIALSVFALCAVVGGTWGVPRLWKRVFTVSLFVGFAIAFSCLNLHLRHYCYAQALHFRQEALDRYHRNLTVNYDSDDPWTTSMLEWDREVFERYDKEIRAYRERYGLAE